MNSITLHQNKTTPIAFKARLYGNYYSEYYKKDNCNGRNPDEFVLKRIENLSQKPELILDLGAGQGRNTISIAKKGFNILAFEISSAGRAWIREKAIKENIKDNVKTTGQNLLDDIQLEKKADFALMSHISQHFNTFELQFVFNQMSKALNEGGEFVFDALVRTKKTYKRYDKLPLAIRNTHASPERYGSASFWEKDIIKAAQKAGLKIVETAPFTEKNGKRVWYEKQNLWGGFSIKDFLFGIQKRPVKLTWFVFKK